MRILTRVRKALDGVAGAARDATAIGMRPISSNTKQDLNQMEDIIQGDTSSASDQSIADVDPLLAYKVAAYFYAAVHQITLYLAKVPIYVRDTETKKKISNDPFLNDFLRAPGKMQGKFVYWSRYITRWLINHHVFGGSYFQFLEGSNPHGSKYYAGMHVLKRPDKMEEKTGMGGQILGYELTIGDKVERYVAEEIASIKIESPESDTDVHSPVESLATTLSLYIQASKYNQGVFKNGPRPGGVIKFDNQLRQKQWERLNYFLTNMASYPGKWLVLDAPGAQLQTGGQLADANVAEVAYRGLSEDLRNEINAVVGTKPIMMGMSKEMTYHNASLQLKSFWTSTGEGLLHTLLQFMTVEGLPKLGYEGGKEEFWYDEEYVKAQYEDPELVHKHLTDALDRGVITRNQFRLMKGYSREDAIPEMDMYYIPQNYLPISMVEATPLEELRSPTDSRDDIDDGDASKGSSAPARAAASSND